MRRNSWATSIRENVTEAYKRIRKTLGVIPRAPHWAKTAFLVGVRAGPSIRPLVHTLTGSKLLSVACGNQQLGSLLAWSLDTETERKPVTSWGTDDIYNGSGSLNCDLTADYLTETLGLGLKWATRSVGRLFTRRTLPQHDLDALYRMEEGLYAETPMNQAEIDRLVQQTAKEMAADRSKTRGDTLVKSWLRYGVSRFVASCGVSDGKTAATFIPSVGLNASMFAW